MRKCNKNSKNAHFYGQQRNERCNHSDEEKKTEEGGGAGIGTFTTNNENVNSSLSRPSAKSNLT